MTIIHTDPLSKSPKLFIFECSGETYLSCMEKSLFGSNKNWPLQIVKGDYCLLHHLEAGTLLGLWRAASDGGRNISPKAWNGKFPYQVKVIAASQKITELTKAQIVQFNVDPVVGRFENVVDDELGLKILKTLIE